MEEYRFKYYWDKGEPTFEDIPWGLSASIFYQAKEKVRKNKLIDKIDVYKGAKLIATFYK